MNPQLLIAVKERIALGHSREAITAALEAAGYDKDTIVRVYEEAQSEHARTAIPLADGTAGTQFVPSVSGAVLPSGWQLFKAGWQYMLTRLDLVGLLAALLVVMTLGGFAFSEKAPEVTLQTTVVASVATLAAFVFYLLATAATIRIVMQSDEERMSIADGFRWAQTHIFGFLWIGILTTMVVLGGFLLFVVPAIVLSLYVYFAQYVFAKEGERGMAALLRSAQLVRGNWWAVATRVAIVGLLIFLFMLPVIGVITVLTETSLNKVVAELAIELVVQVMSAVATIVALFASYIVYQRLAEARPVGTLQPQPKAWKYKTLAWLGVLTIGLMILGTVAVYSLYESGGRDNPVFVAARLGMASVVASGYSVEHGTLEGVCDTFQDEYALIGAMTCNDVDDAWAFTVATQTGQWCVDSTGFRKELATPLEERTECVAL